MNNEKLIFAAVAVIGYVLSHVLIGVKFPSGFDAGTVFAWVAGLGLFGFVVQFFDSVTLMDGAELQAIHNDAVNPANSTYVGNIYHNDIGRFKVGPSGYGYYPDGSNVMLGHHED